MLFLEAYVGSGYGVNKLMAGELEPHALVALRDPQTALGILASADTIKISKVALCVCCRNVGTPACPHGEQRVTGMCADYVLDERDPVRTEERVLKSLTG